jgi:centromere protein J
VVEDNNFQIYRFDNGQVEIHYNDGKKEIKFDDGSEKLIFPNGEKFTFQLSGEIQSENSSGVKIIEFGDQTVEVIID